MPTRDEVSRELAERLGWRIDDRGSWNRKELFPGGPQLEYLDPQTQHELISLKLELIAARERIRELEKTR